MHFSPPARMHTGARLVARYNGAVRFRIRQFAKDDFEQLWAIDQECFPPGISYTRIELAFYMRRARAFTLVAESEPGAPPPCEAETAPTRKSKTSPASASPILGFIVGESTLKSAGHIITIDVRSHARRSRVGSSLLQAAEEHLRAQGARHVFLETAVNNAPAIAFYKRHGYELIKTIPRYYKQNLDALLLGKRLNAVAGS